MGILNLWHSSQIVNAIPEFEKADVLYSIKHLYESGYIDGSEMKTNNFTCIIFDITSLGHEFIENIKDDTVWGSTKECAKRVGSTSLNVISQISAAILTAAIQAKLTV